MQAMFRWYREDKSTLVVFFIVLENMAEGKKSFILYADFKHTVDMLDDEKAGKLFKHLLAYVNDEYPNMDDPMVALAFEPMKHQLKRDLRKWEEIKGKRVEAGRLGGLARASNAKQELANANQSKQMLASASKIKQTLANQAVTVNVNDTVNDTVSVINNAHTHENNFSDDGDQYDKTERVLQQRHAEHYGAYLAQVWEKHTGKATLVTDAIKRRVLNMRQTPAVDMEKYIETYAELCNFIEKHAIDKHIYFPIRQYDLDKFLDKVNSFTTDSITILGNIAVKESKSKVLAMRKKDHNIVDERTPPPPPPDEKVEFTAEQKQKAKDKLQGFKNNLVEKVTT